MATLEGTLRHQRADAGKLEHTADGRVARAVLLRCVRLRLVGKADVVEFHRQDDGSERPFPVEYKREEIPRRGTMKGDDWADRLLDFAVRTIKLVEALPEHLPAPYQTHQRLSL